MFTTYVVNILVPSAQAASLVFTTQAILTVPFEMLQIFELLS